MFRNFLTETASFYCNCRALRVISIRECNYLKFIQKSISVHFMIE